MSLHEECGVFGVFGTEPDHVVDLVYYGLYALQHRGQESCGIVVNDDGVFFSRKDLGLISEVFNADTLSRLPTGSMAVGHVRYGTTGGTSRSNCQPIEVNHQKGKMALAHNGNLSNAVELRNRLELEVVGTPALEWLRARRGEWLPAGCSNGYCNRIAGFPPEETRCGVSPEVELLSPNFR